MLERLHAARDRYIEKSDEPMDKTWHWPKFVAALEGGAPLCPKVQVAMDEHGLDWRVYYRPDADLVTRVGLAGDALIWAPVAEGTPAELSWESFAGRLRDIPPDQYCDLYLATDTSKADALGAQRRFSDQVVAVYQALLPLYDASIG